MSAPTTTGYDLLDQLGAEADRLGVLVETSYSPSAQQHWVIAHDPDRVQTFVAVDRDTYQSAITEAIRQMREIR